MTHLLLNVDAREHERTEKSRFLEQAGFRVVEAATEADALHVVRTERVTVAVVNNRLPQIDGYRLSRQIKAGAGTAGPFVLLLAPAFDGPAPPLEQIADAFVPAPPYYPAMLAQVRLLVRLAEASGPDERTRAREARQREWEAVLLDLTHRALAAAEAGDELVREAFRQVERLLDLDVGLGLRFDGTQELRLVESHGVPENVRPVLDRLELGQSFCGLAVTTRGPVIADRTRIETDPKGRLSRELGLSFHASFPLVACAGQVLGAVSFGGTGRVELPEDELAFLERIARVIGAAMERQRNELARAETAATLQAFYDGSPYIMGVAELRGDEPVAVYGNAATAALFGLTPGELAGRSATDLGVPESVARLCAEQCRRCRTTGEPARLHYRHPTADGLRWLAATVSFLGETANRPRFSFIVDDITERIEAEQALRTSEEHLRVALAATRLGTWEWLVESDRAIGDERSIEVYDVDPDRAITWSWLLEHRVHPDDRARAAAAIEAALEGEGWLRSEYRVVRRDGSVRWVSASGQMLFEVRGTERRPVRLIGTTEDVTLVRKAEDALVESESRFRQMIEALPLLAWTCEPDGPCDYLSPQWIEFTGVPADEQLGSGWVAQVHPDDRARVQVAWQQSVETGRPLATEFRIRRHDGTYCWFEARAVPLRDGSGRVTKWFGVNTDIDTRKRVDEARREADRRKDEFLAMLSHELRNPLAPIRNSVALLRQIGPTHPHLEQAREVIDRQVTYLTRLIDDLLDVSRITQGKIRLIKGTLSLAAVVDRAVETTRPILEARRVGLTVSLPPRPLPIEGDLTRLVQAVSNLLHNAAKYTALGGSVWLEVDSEGEEAIIRVRDDGAGIPADLLPHVFELFVQGQRPSDRAQGGLGVGLTIVKAIVELHGGRVAAASGGRNRGSQFEIRLPLLVPPSRPATRVGPGLAGTDPSRRVLIVDDNADAAESLALLLDLQGYSVMLVADGAAAVDGAIEFRPAVVILDIGLPGMDGYEVARQLRSRPETGQALLIAVTGYARDRDRLDARAAGFDHHLVKPVDPDAIHLLISGRHPAEAEPL